MTRVILILILFSSNVFAKKSDQASALDYLFYKCQNVDGGFSEVDERDSNFFLTLSTIISIRKNGEDPFQWQVNDNTVKNYLNTLNYQNFPASRLAKAFMVFRKIDFFPKGFPSEDSLRSRLKVNLDEILKDSQRAKYSFFQLFYTFKALSLLENKIQLERIIDYIISGQNTDGGWGYKRNVLSGLDSTILMMSLLYEFKEAFDVKSILDKGMQFVLKKPFLTRKEFGIFINTINYTELLEFGTLFNIKEEIKSAYGDIYHKLDLAKEQTKEGFTFFKWSPYSTKYGTCNSTNSALVALNYKYGNIKPKKRTRKNVVPPALFPETIKVKVEILGNDFSFEETVKFNRQEQSYLTDWHHPLGAVESLLKDKGVPFRVDETYGATLYEAKGEKNWSFKVNGKHSDLCHTMYKLKDGDQVYWYNNLNDKTLRVVVSPVPYANREYDVYVYTFRNGNANTPVDNVSYVGLEKVEKIKEKHFLRIKAPTDKELTFYVEKAGYKRSKKVKIGKGGLISIKAFQEKHGDGNAKETESQELKAGEKLISDNENEPDGRVEPVNDKSKKNALVYGIIGLLALTTLGYFLKRK